MIITKNKCFNMYRIAKAFWIVFSTAKTTQNWSLYRLWRTMMDRHDSQELMCPYEWLCFLGCVMTLIRVVLSQNKYIISCEIQRDKSPMKQLFKGTSLPWSNYSKRQVSHEGTFQEYMKSHITSVLHFITLLKIF